MARTSAVKVFAIFAIALPALAWEQDRKPPRDAFRSQWSNVNPVTALTSASFSEPPSNDRPWVRLNIPATADSEEIKAEVQDLREKGIAGVEVGQGAFPNNGQLIALLSKANELGIKVSLSHGPTQNPSGYSSDEEHARKTLAFGDPEVDAGTTFEGPLPPAHPPVRPQFGPPAPPESQEHHRTTLVALLAYRCAASPCAVTGPAELDASSVIDLTSTVSAKNTEGVSGGTTAGNVRWTAPASPGGFQWRLISFWSRGVFAQPDPFSNEGFEQLIHSLEASLSPQVMELMRANGGDIFYDSHSVDRGSPDELWTNKMLEEFSSRKGYDMVPYLAALFPESFAFSNGSAPRVRDDLYAVRSDLWIEKQIKPLEAWTRKYNYKLRVQPEGEMSVKTPINDQVQSAAALDRPEHESLFANDEVDNYLPIASANHMTGNPWYSTECCAALNMNYAQTLQDVTIRMHRSFAGGITKLVYHVYPYRDSPTSKWPGYHVFPPAGFSNAWGPRDPDWMDVRTFNDYFARNGQVLTQGQAKTDVAVYMENYLYPLPQMVKGGAGFRMWRDTGLQEAGYSRDYLDPTMLKLPNAVVTGRRLAADGPDYKAFIIDSEQEPATDPVKTSMQVEAARKILAYARAGLPIIVVGAPPDRIPGLRPGSDAELQKIIRELLAEPCVYQVAHESDLAGKLKSLGIRPAAEPASPSSLLSVHRRDSATRTDYYFLYNEGVVSPKGEPANLFEPATGTALDVLVTLEGKGNPYLMDGWSGRITPIANYSTDGGHVTIRVKLSPDDAEVIALSEDTQRFGIQAPKIHVIATTADGAVTERSAILIRSTKTGTISTTLSNGKTISSTIADIHGAIDLTHAEWALRVEDWQPANPYASTVGPDAVQTRKSNLTMELEGLKPWSEIPDLKNSSGVGTYIGQVNLPERWGQDDGAILDLGEVFDSFTLTINGRSVPVDQLSAEADVGQYLTPGRNTIAVRVSTTLNNRLANIDETVAKRGMVQPYGLVGPVVLTPYKQVPVSTPAATESNLNSK